MGGAYKKTRVGAPKMSELHNHTGIDLAGAGRRPAHRPTSPPPLL